MHAWFRCSDGVVVVAYRQYGLRAYALREYPKGTRFPATIQFRTLNLPSPSLIACFRGTILERSAVVASLTPVKRDRIFGKQRLGYVLMRIGQRIRDPFVKKTLANESLMNLYKASQAKTPEAQILAAHRNRVETEASFEKRQSFLRRQYAHRYVEENAADLGIFGTDTGIDVRDPFDPLAEERA